MLAHSYCTRLPCAGTIAETSIAARILHLQQLRQPLARHAAAKQPVQARPALRPCPPAAAAVAAPDRAPQEAEESPEAAAAEKPAAAAVLQEPEAAVEYTDLPKLSSLQLQAIINPEGLVSPAVELGAAAYVFAIYDRQQKLQYVGFSKELRPSLKTVLGRRPDKAYYFKSAAVAELDQDRLLAIRQAWFDECGAPPPGNKLALERKAWQSAVDAGAISARAKPAAAAEKLKELLGILTQRGCKEEWVADEELLQNGQVDFLTSASSSSSSASSQQQQQQPGSTEAAAAASGSSGSNGSGSSSDNLVRTCTVVVDGQAKQFLVEYLMRFPTKGGYVMDVKLSFDHMDTNHRIIVGRNYFEPYGIAPEAAAESCLCLMLANKMPRHNEGMLGTSEFPVNYFTCSEMEQWYGDDFAAHFQHTTGHELQYGVGLSWRLSKLHDYGAAKLEDPTSLGSALTRSGLGHMGA